MSIPSSFAKLDDNQNHAERNGGFSGIHSKFQSGDSVRTSTMGLF